MIGSHGRLLVSFFVFLFVSVLFAFVCLFPFFFFNALACPHCSDVGSDESGAVDNASRAVPDYTHKLTKWEKNPTDRTSNVCHAVGRDNADSSDSICS